VTKVVFFGTEEFSREMLAEAARLGANVVAAFSLTREWSARFPEWRDIGETARSLRIEHREGASIREPAVLARLGELAPDAFLVMGLPQLLTREMIASARLGAIAAHMSILPRNRGLNAVPWHLLHGETEGGVSFFPITERMDDGPLIDQRRFRISLTDTSRKLYDRCIAAGREMLPGALAMIDAGKVKGRPQDESKATWLPRRLPDRRIDWMRNARRTYDLVRAFADPYGGAFAWLGNRRMTVWEAGFSHEPIVARPGEVVKMTDRGVEIATGAGLVVLRSVQVGDEPEHAVDVFERERISLGHVLP
jgi:methionyl-tRNA formyltransferase